MRLRNKNWTAKFLEDNSVYLVDNTNIFNAHEIFGNGKDVILDIGCGKGMFVTKNAIMHPDSNYVAMEKERTVAGVALRWALKEFSEQGRTMDNLRFNNSYIEKYEHLIPSNSIKRIYLNFSDPWPKARHAKYRLTGRNYLKIYNRILVEGGEIHVKTDNDNLYKFTLDEALFSNFRIILNEPDLYANKAALDENIATEYETKFVEMGLKIKKVVLRKKPPKLNDEDDTVEFEEEKPKVVIKQKPQEPEDDFPF